MMLKNFAEKFTTQSESNDAIKKTFDKALEIMNFEVNWSNKNLENIVACVKKLFV